MSWVFAEAKHLIQKKITFMEIIMDSLTLWEITVNYAGELYKTKQYIGLIWNHKFKRANKFKRMHT